MPQTTEGFRVDLAHGAVIVIASRAIAVDDIWRFLTPDGETVIEIPTRDVVAIRGPGHSSEPEAFHDNQ